MRKLLIVSLLAASSAAVAATNNSWLREVNLAYGFGTEHDQDYKNSGWWLEASAFNYQIDKTLRVHLNASVGFWTAHTDKNKHNQTIAIAPSFRAYFSPPENKRLAPYLRFSFGPVYLFKRFLGNREQGAHWAFQTFLGGGLETEITTKNKVCVYIEN